MTTIKTSKQHCETNCDTEVLDLLNELSQYDANVYARLLKHMLSIAEANDVTCMVEQRAEDMAHNSRSMKKIEKMLQIVQREQSA